MELVKPTVTLWIRPIVSLRDAKRLSPSQYPSLNAQRDTTTLHFALPMTRQTRPVAPDGSRNLGLPEGLL